MHKIKLPSLFSFLLLISSGVAASPDIKAGLWEIGGTVNLAGYQVPYEAMRQCFTDSDIADAKKILLKLEVPSSGCEVSNYVMSGNSVSWNMQCKAGTPLIPGSGSTNIISGSGSITFNADNFSGTVTMHGLMEGSDGATNMIQTFTARRIGDCAK
jgi:hypothetical protein